MKRTRDVADRVPWSEAVRYAMGRAYTQTQHVSELAANLLNGAYWFYKGGMCGGRLHINRSNAETCTHVQEDGSSKLLCIMERGAEVDRMPVCFYVREKVKGLRGTPTERIACTMVIDAHCKRISLDTSLMPLFMPDFDMRHEIFICVLFRGRAVTDAWRYEKMNLVQYLENFRSWHTSEVNVSITDVVKMHVRARAPLVWTQFMMEALHVGKHPFTTLPSEAWYGGKDWHDEKAFTLSMQVAKPECSIVRTRIDDDEAVVKLDKVDKTCGNCTFRARTHSFDGHVYYTLEALYTLLCTREHMRVEMVDPRRVLLYCKPFMHSVDMCGVVFAGNYVRSTAPYEHMGMMGCIAACYRSEAQRSLKYDESVEKFRYMYTHVDSNPRYRMTLQAQARHGLQALNYLAQRVAACHKHNQSTLTEGEQAKAFFIMQYLAIVSREVSDMMGASVLTTARDKWHLIHQVDLAAPAACIDLDESTATLSNGHVVCTTCPWKCTKKGLRDIVGAQALAHSARARDTGRGCVLPALSVPQLIMPMYDNCIPDADKVAHMIEHVTMRALVPQCPVCKTSMWLDEGCMTVVCTSCSHHSCFACTKPHVPERYRAGVNFKDMTPYEIIKAMRTFAFDPKLMFKALQQSVKASDVQSLEVVPPELKCSDARIVCAVSEDVPMSPCALTQVLDLQQTVGIEHVKHMDTRCPVYVNSTSISGMHVCSQVHASLHCAVARCAGHTTGPVHAQQRTGMLLLLRAVRCLSEALAYFTVHSAIAMETATRVMHDFMHRRRVSRHDIVNDFYAVVRTHRIEFLASLENPNPNTSSLNLSRKSFDDIVLRWSDHGLCKSSH